MSPIEAALAAACTAAEQYRGNTAPNPPVGASALDAQGKILLAQAHQKAGEPHAEARLLATLREQGLIDEVRTLVVTLEPCNHQGKTPPCTDAILSVPSIKNVAYAVADPNPKAQGGSARLREAGLHVMDLSADLSGTPTLERARDLTRPFCHWIQTGLPWVTVKTAWRKDGAELTMRPLPGKKTFTTTASLKFAHELRKRSDAIVTGIGTVLADQPRFNVRHIPDFPGKKRWLIVMDRHNRTPKAWREARENDGFLLEVSNDFSLILKKLGTLGALEVLLEAGPALTESVLKSARWDEHFRILHSDTGDQIEKELRIP